MQIERARQAMASEQVDMGGAEDATEAPEEEGEPVVQEPVTFQLKASSDTISPSRIPSSPFHFLHVAPPQGTSKTA